MLKVLRHLKGGKKISVDVWELDIASVCIAMFSDAPFVNAVGMKSQLGLVTLLEDGENAQISPIMVRLSAAGTRNQ